MDIFSIEYWEQYHIKSYDNLKKYLDFIRNIRDLGTRDLGLCEIHHIVPRSFDESLICEDFNRIILTCREHFEAHILLADNVFSGCYHYKMVNALHLMCGCSRSDRFDITAEEYEYKRTIFSQMMRDKLSTPEAKKELSDRYSGSRNPMYGRVGENNPNYGSKRTMETRMKISESNKGKSISDYHKSVVSKSSKARLSGTRYINNGIIELRIPPEEAEYKVQNEGFVYGRRDPVNVGRKLSEESKKKISQGRQGKKASPDTIEKLRSSASALHKGRHYVNNGQITKKVYEDEYQKLLSEGWNKGMLRKRGTQA